jgi:ribosome biogenesis GTPase A
LVVSVAPEWSPYTLCEAHAQLRGFRVKGGRPDVNRAANTLLRDALSGKKLALAFPPPVGISRGGPDDQ